ncbi:cyclase family protein [Zobellia galactanivorans]|uniref:N-formylkynurenine (Aryl-) formamidase n=1 Tax=Zobellia galactanivorans (strain DSM 12802 / CCUG 47099 / CIP 106680 / NCIMB 13871 / Dsij) TaxID=63186 RepID=G0LBT2_ZOBGA|nr:MULTISPECIES: cyclase family protein [Zobellia]MBU3026214.1 cyclase family protein [Zobellia galactanivorans]MDO6807308.1 cyclase family protein [Zobellia galactanivorans]OWW27290.1 metal-dependent hydrolase [Zobellia sp. OII3]CAZ96431.1 N-formylkynurenine (aryl-) formamidase [Zobellia galactanivorans]
MIATIKYRTKNYPIDLSKPLDISIAIKGGSENVTAWYVDPPEIKAHEEDGFVGKVSEGASINFNDIAFNPHAHGTHTECVGHITDEFHSVNKNLKQYFFLAEVITIAPEMLDGDFVISKKQLKYALGNKKREAVVIRTLPNLSQKKSRQYSHSNPPYLTQEAAEFLVEKEVGHLLVDLPSVDKEKDNGALVAHKAFWNFNGKLRKNATITEFVYVPNSVGDGSYMLNLQVAPFENDASPSRPVLYEIIKK